MSLPSDYIERVYAGVLGKMIGVYLGRPFEGWSYERIMAELGEVWYYVHDKIGVPLIVTDDDISGTFTFLRALPDFGCRKDISPEQIGQTWLNYLVENRTVLWWGGLGNSTEHTAYIRLKNGIPAPRSGAIATNGKVVAEQIGAQIFIDGWAMVAPGDPALAVDLARRAGSVSHDGEAIYGAQVLAAMEAQAFVEQDINALLDCGVSYIPKDSVIYRMISDLREWHAELPDWRMALAKIVENYGYDRYGGNCHMVPNHALIILGLLYGQGDFQKSLMITNTAGWDTDCNSGNIGCLLGIRNGLAGLNIGPDWRGPVADRLYLPTADGGRCVSDAVSETSAIVNIARAFEGLEPYAPKGGARFHFELDGAVQGFQAAAPGADNAPARVENVAGHSRAGARSLAIRYAHTAPGQPVRVFTPTFVAPDAINMPGYGLMACPTLYPGQTVTASLEADAGNPGLVAVTLYLRRYAAKDALVQVAGPARKLRPGETAALSWQIPDMGSFPIAEIGLEIHGADGLAGSLYLDSLDWRGAPDALFTRPAGAGKAWKISWVSSVDHWEDWGEPFRPIQDQGRGMLIHGASDWANYRAEADVTPHMVSAAGLAVCVQGLERYYSLTLGKDGVVRLVKAWYGERVIMGQTAFAWEFGQTYRLALETQGGRLRAWIDGTLLFEAEDSQNPLLGGAVALVCAEGRSATQAVRVSPV
jgi:ADP-ribosylglycohydrolase